MLTLIRIGTFDVMATMLIVLSIFSAYTSYALGFDTLPAVLAFAVAIACLPMLSLYGGLCTGFGLFLSRAYLLGVATLGAFAVFFTFCASVFFFMTFAATGFDLVLDGEWDLVSFVLFYSLPLSATLVRIVSSWLPRMG